MIHSELFYKSICFSFSFILIEVMTVILIKPDDYNVYIICISICVHSFPLFIHSFTHSLTSLYASVCVYIYTFIELVCLAIFY